MLDEYQDKMLRSYIARFNKEVLSIDEADDKILVASFTNGLRKGKFLFSLYKNDSKTMSGVLYKGHQVHECQRRTASSRGKA